MNHRVYRATSSLIGTTIGAGMFAIPYVVSKFGFWSGIVYLLALGILNLILNLIYGEIILRTFGDHQLSGYGQLYLGKRGKAIATIALFFSLYGALLAYLVKTGEFLALISSVQNSFFWTIVFFLLSSLAIFFGLRAVSTLENFITVALLGLTLLMVGLGFGKINVLNLSRVNFSYFFLPLGVILFAYSGSSVIPEMEEILRREPHKLKKSIIIGSAVPILIYLLFTVAVVGVCGNLTSDDAISGLSLFFPPWMVILGALLAILAMASSYLTIGYVLKEVWFRDIAIDKTLSFILACSPPLILFILGAKNFIDILQFTGAISGGLIGILTIKMFQKAKFLGGRKPAYSLSLPKAVIVLLYLVFFFGIFFPFL